MPFSVHTTGGEYPDYSAASSPGVSAPHGQVDMSPFLFSCWDRGSFKQLSLHLCSTKDSPDHARQRWEFHFMIPLKALVFLHEAMTPHCLGSIPLFSPNSTRMEDQTHPFQSQSAIRWEESFPAGISVLPGGGGGVSLKHLKSHIPQYGTSLAASSDSAIPSPLEDKVPMGVASFNPEYRASR